MTTSAYLAPKVLQQVGVIDIGSNSIRLVIYDIFGAHFTPVYNEKILAGLGRDLMATGRLSEEGKQSCLLALSRFQRIAKARNLPPLLIGATAALRVAQDAPQFLAEIQTRTGLLITPISGKEEARISAMGLIAADVRREGLAADLGGASLELVKIEDRKVGERVSLPLGPFDVVAGHLRQQTREDYAALIPKIDTFLGSLSPSLLSGETLYLIGGAWRNLAAVHQQRTLYPMKTLQGYSLSGQAASDLAHWASHEGISTLLDWAGMRRKRAETLPYSGLVLSRLLKFIQPERVTISIAGLREGLVYDNLPEAARARDALLDGCQDFARGTLQTAHYGGPLFDMIAPLIDQVDCAFSHEEDTRLFRAACMLSGIGKNLHPDYRPELVFENVLYAPVSGLRHAERAFLSLTLFRSYAARREAPNQAAIDALLSADQQRVAAILGAAIRLGIVATGRSSELLGKFRLGIQSGTLTLSVTREEVPLITEQVLFRLERLGKILGLPIAVDTHTP